MGTHLERWRELIELWNAGDMDAWFAAVGPRVRFAPDPRFPEPGPFVGPGFRAFIEQWLQAWGGKSELVEVEDAFERSGAVLGRVRWDVSGASSGAHLPTEWAEFTLVAWIGADSHIDRLLAFFDHDQALAAADAGSEAA